MKKLLTISTLVVLGGLSVFAGKPKKMSGVLKLDKEPFYILKTTSGKKLKVKVNKSNPKRDKIKAIAESGEKASFMVKKNKKDQLIIVSAK